jgi:hypothetical protein
VQPLLTGTLDRCVSDRAIAIAEAVARGEELPGDAREAARRADWADSAARVSSWIGEVNAAPIRAAASAANAAINAADQLAREVIVKRPRWELPLDKLEYTHQQYSCATCYALKALAESGFAAGPDFERLLAFSSKQTSIDPSEAGPLGPLWPDPAPVWCPKAPEDRPDEMGRCVQQELLADLPPRLAVAFAVRCARRVQPLWTGEWARSHCDRAMAIVEAVARGEQRARAVKVAAKVTKDLSCPAREGSEGDFQALKTANWAAAAAVAASTGDAVGAALHAHGAAQNAALGLAVAAGHTGDPAKCVAALSAARDASKTAERDLRRLAVIGSKQTAIDPTEAGALGPLWSGIPNTRGFTASR